MGVYAQIVTFKYPEIFLTQRVALGDRLRELLANLFIFLVQLLIVLRRCGGDELQMQLLECEQLLIGRIAVAANP